MDAQGLIVARFDTVIQDGMEADGNTTWARATGDDPLAWTIQSKDIDMTFSVTNMAREIWSIRNGAQYASEWTEAEQAQALHLVLGDSATPEQIGRMVAAWSARYAAKEPQTSTT